MESSQDQAANSERQTRIEHLVEKFIESAEGDAKSFLAAHPDLMPELQTQLRMANMIEAAREKADATTDSASPETNPSELSHQRWTNAYHSPAFDELKQIGPYKLLQEIGEGGMGIVYMAEQKTPIKRRVALKIIKPGMDSRQVIARFEAERQALAMMDHPHIARVYDAGTTEQGHPYFVMELVRGEPITRYCDRKKLKTKERVKLFLGVCHAIRHAHLKGIIHRDIKPSNVLVTLHDGKPVVKVIDFGVAKATNTELTQKTLFTEFGQMIGTPAYMSPEQAEMSGLDIDTRTDIYSLGVLLYELLTGATPFGNTELLSKGYAEMMRIICEEEPHRPSTRIGQLDSPGKDVGKRRQANLKEWGQSLRGELDWIVMKCLEKNRDRRYESAAALADDLQRHLDGEIVQARAPSSAYVLWKTALRHRRLAMTVCVLALAALLGGLSLFVSYLNVKRTNGELDQALVEQTRQKKRASRAFDLATTLANDFQTPGELQKLKIEWEKQIAARASELGADDSQVIAMEGSFAHWYWRLALTTIRANVRSASEPSMAVQFTRDAGPRVESALKRADGKIPIHHPIMMPLFNDNIQWQLFDRAEQWETEVDLNPDLNVEKWREIASLYDDFVTSLAAHYPPSDTTFLRMAVERVPSHLRAGQLETAVDQLKEYLALRQQGGVPSVTLDLAHERLVSVTRSIDFPDKEVYGKFMWRYYHDAAQVYRTTGSEMGVATRQYSQWLETADLLSCGDQSKPAEIFHHASLARRAGRSELALQALQEVENASSPAANSVASWSLRMASIQCLRESGKYELAEQAANDFIARAESQFGPSHQQTIGGLLELARIQGANQQRDAAMKTWAQARKRAKQLERPAAHAMEEAVRTAIDLLERWEKPVDRWEGERAELRALLRSKPQNMDFESAGEYEAPDGWHSNRLPLPDFQWTSGSGAFEGEKCGVLSTIEGASELGSGVGFRNLIQSFDAVNYRGKPVKFTAAVRVEGNSASDTAQLWLRVDRVGDRRSNLIGNMYDRPIRSPDWQRYEINGIVNDDAEQIVIGLMVFGGATAWIDDVRFKVVDE